jgi:SpoVK/Ycf46/Vps4 family AAA+-type ATPase
MSTAIIADKAVLNSQRFHRELDRLMGASIGVIAVRTREFERAKLLLHEWASMRGMSHNVWDINHGMWAYREIPTVSEKPGDTPELAVDGERIAEYMQPLEELPHTLQLFQSLEHFEKRHKNRDTERNSFLGVFVGLSNEELSNTVVQQYIRDHVQRAYENNDRMVLLLPLATEIPATITGDIEIVDLDPPSFAELKDILGDMVETIAKACRYEPDEEDQDAIVQNGLGMTGQEFDNAISLAVVDAGEIVASDADAEITRDHFIKVVRKRKLEILKQTQMLELMPPVSIKEVGGLDLLKKDLLKTSAAFTPEAREYGITLPRGFIAVGPPGTGKTLLCKATSAVLGLPSIRFDMAAVFSGLVGSSEANMRMALKMVENMAPCIMFIDEIEKAAPPAEGGGDSGVGQRVLGTFLTWLNDRADRDIPVYVIASANDVSRLPPELLRMGRFDAKWSLTFPSKPERQQIFKIHVEKRGHKMTDKDYLALAAQTETYVGAEIEGIVEKALLEDFVAGHPKLQYDTLTKVIRETRPQIKAFPERINAMREWCENHAKPASSSATFDIPEEGEAPVSVRPAPIRRTGGRRLRGASS